MRLSKTDVYTSEIGMTLTVTHAIDDAGAAFIGNVFVYDAHLTTRAAHIAHNRV
jgi:hypothetical protein